eukprot:963301-Lingulodinium_polyedra.AAC.1
MLCPWVVRGLSVDHGLPMGRVLPTGSPWTVHGQSMDKLWILRGPSEVARARSRWSFAHGRGQESL